MAPRDTKDYLHFFCGEDTTDKDALANNEPKRVALYQTVAALLRAYANLANEMAEAGYTPAQIEQIKAEVTHSTQIRDEVKVASGDYLDMKRYEPAMRHLLDCYIRADDSQVVSTFEELGLIELIVKQGNSALDQLPAGLKKDPEAMAETIENNLRKNIIDQNPVNPKYYDQMSELLDDLIQERRQQAIDYQGYLEKVKHLSAQIVQPIGTHPQAYPASINTPALRSLYDNLGQNEVLAVQVDTTVRSTKKESWVGNPVKEREVAYAIRQDLSEHDCDVDNVLRLVKNQHEYQ